MLSLGWRAWSAASLGTLSSEPMIDANTNNLVPASDLPNNLVPANDLPTNLPKVGGQVPPDDLPSAPAKQPGQPVPPGPLQPEKVLPPQPTPGQFHPGTAIRSAPSYQQQLQQHHHDVWGDFWNETHKIYGDAMADVSHGFNDVLLAGDAILGAPGRLVQGAIAAKDAHHIMQNALDDVVHPEKQGQYLDATMKKLGITGGVEELDKHITNNTARGIFNATARLATQTLLDPLTAVPVLGWVAKASGIAGHVALAAKGAAEIAKTNKIMGPYVKQVQTAGKDIIYQGTRLFGQRPELNEPMAGVRLTPHVGKAGRMSIESSVMQQYTQKAAAEADKIFSDKTLAQAIDKGQIPIELQAHLARQAVERGDLPLSNQGQALIKSAGLQFKDPLKIPPKPAKYMSTKDMDLNELMNGSHKFQPTNIKEWKTFLGKMRNDTERREIDAKTVDFLAYDKSNSVEGTWGVTRNVRQGGKLVPKYFTVSKTGGGGKLGNNVYKATAKEMKEKAQDMVADKHMTTGPKAVHLGTPGNPIDRAATMARNLGSMSVQLDPLPHGVRNLGLLTFVAHGPITFGHMMGYAAKGFSGVEMKRLSDLGLAHADYLRENMTGPLGPLFRGDAKVLNRLELASRMANLKALDREWGASMTMGDEYKKARQVARDVGDYRNAALIVRVLQAMGGPFVAFRVGTVPAAVGRAILKRPGNVEGVIRAQDDLNSNDRTLPGPFAGSPIELQGGGPVLDALKAGITPVQYGTSPSTMGPLGGAIQWALRTKEGHGDPPEDILQQIGQNTIPGFSVAGQAVDVLEDVMHIPQSYHPYGKENFASPLMQLMLSMGWGAYPQPRPKARATVRRTSTMHRDTRE